MQNIEVEIPKKFIGSAYFACLHQFDIIVINMSVVDQKASKIFQDHCIYKKSLPYGAAAV